MSKRRIDKTSVSGVDFPFFLYRTKRRDTRSYIANTLRKVKAVDDDIDVFKQELNNACVEERSYLGFMTNEEAFDQELALAEDTYFIYSAYCDRRWFLCGKTDILMESDARTQSLLNPEGLKRLDRGDALIFQKKLKRRVRRAIDCWAIIGRRLKVVRDIRILISQMIWMHRREWVQ
jgi:hypothetical protein